MKQQQHSCPQYICTKEGFEDLRQAEFGISIIDSEAPLYFPSGLCVSTHKGYEIKLHSI